MLNKRYPELMNGCCKCRDCCVNARSPSGMRAIPTVASTYRNGNHFVCVCVCEKKTHHRLFLVLIFIWTIKIFKSTYIRIFMNIMMKTLMYIVFSFVILLFINKSCTYNFHFLDFFFVLLFCYLFFCSNAFH